MHGAPAKIPHRAQFSSAPNWGLVSGYGDPAGVSTPLNWLANVALCPPAPINLRGKTRSRCCRNAPSSQCHLGCLSSPKPAGADSVRATTDRTVSKQHRRPTPLPRGVSVLSEWENAAENASEKTRQRRHCARKFGNFPLGLPTPAENEERRRRLRGSRPHWFAMVGFPYARHSDSDCARVASSPSYFLPRWSPPRQSGEIPPR